MLKKNKQIKICILGGGNIGSLLLADLSKNENVLTMLFTSRPQLWNKEMKVLKPNGELDFCGRIDVVSNDPNETIAQADILISTFPSNALQDYKDVIKKHIKKTALLGFIPGCGGKEFLFRDLVDQGNVLFGFQRVHAISRVNVYGESVFNLGRKNELFFGTIPSCESKNVCDIFEKLLNVTCHALPNYLSVTLVPSNPILHTSRLYSMFKNYRDGDYWSKPILFYKDWTDDASKVLIDCDQELQSMLLKMKGLDTSYIKSLKTHYEVNTPQEMTNKIASIPAFSDIKSPMIQNELGYIPDFDSRYFKEDFPFGLCIIRSFANVLKHETPVIDELLRWYEKKYDLSFFNENGFWGSSLKSLPLPQNNGLQGLQDIINFYL